jgi:FkbM family methyltransferase
MKIPNDDFFTNLKANNALTLFGKESRDLALSHVTNFDTVIDIGAHVGISVLHWAQHFQRCVAYEPMPDHFDCLTENTRHLSQVTRFNYAISNQQQLLKAAYRTTKNSGSFQLLDHRYQQPSKKLPRQLYDIESHRLDEFDFDSVGLIKIDVEGWELEVLKGAVETIKKHRPVMLIEFTGGNGKKSLHSYQIDEYFAVIESLNYVPVATSGDDTIYISKQQR